MHLFNTLIDKKESHVLDLWSDFVLLFDFNEELLDIEKLTNNLTLKFKNEIQENLDQLSETQKFLYLDQLGNIYGKEFPGLNNYLHERSVKSIVEKEFPDGIEVEPKKFKDKITSFNATYKYVKADISTLTINTNEAFPYVKYWEIVKKDIFDFVSFALDSITSQNSKSSSQHKLKGFKKLLLPNQVESLYHQFSLNPYRAVLVALDILLTEMDEITDTKKLITYIGNILNPTSSLNTLGKLVSKIDIKDPETQIFFNVIHDAVNNYTTFKFLPDDYTEIREFFEDAYSPVKVLLLAAVKKKIIALEDMREIKLYSTSNIIDLDRFADKNPEILEYLKEHVQLLYRNIILDTCIFPLDPLLNGNIKYEKVKSPFLFPGKERSLLTIKENIFGKSTKKQEPDEVWLSRFINDDSKLESIFPNSKGAGRKGDEFTDAKIWQAALLDIIKYKLKESGCIGTARESYFIFKWSIPRHENFIANRSEKESFAIAKNQFQTLLQ